MTGRQNRKTQSKFIKNTKMKLQCIGAVIARCICPFEEQAQRNLYENRERVINSLFYTILSFLLGISIPKGALSPFGLAILCAVSGEYTLFCYIGVCIGCLFYGLFGIIQFVAYSLVFLLRKSISESEFQERLGIRVILAFLFSIFTGAAFLFKNGFTFNAFFDFSTYMILCILCTNIFSRAIGRERSSEANALHLLSLYSIFLCIIPTFNRLSFSGVDLGLMASCVFAMYFAKGKGAVFGCVAGFIFGFACKSPLLSAPIGMAGLCAGYLFPKSLPTAIISFFISFLFSYIYILGTLSIYSVIPIVCASCLIFASIQAILPDIFIKAKVKRSHISKSPMVKDEFQKVSESLSGLSSLIYKFAEHMKAPSNAETGMIFEESLCKTCDSCSMNEMCYAKREGNLSAIKKEVISTLHTSVLTKEHLSRLLLGKCIRTKELTESINSAYSDLRFIAMKSNRTQTVASIYSSMSRLIKSTGKNQSENNERDTRLENTLCSCLEKIGVEFTFIEATGTRSKEVFIHGIKAETIPCSASDLSRYLSGECKIKFSEPTFDISESADMIMKLHRDEKIKLEYAQCCEAKKKGSVSGDTLQFFDTENGLFYAIIADGMGSGKAAAATSRLSCVFLEKMLKGGGSRNVCIEMLNSLLLSKNDETFSGIDMLEIDKLCGTAHFIKAGAAPSFVLRKSHLYKISSETPPVGIIPTFSAESTRFSLENGDIIIMVSDGVISGDDDGIWLSELIHLDTACEPAFLASLLIERARELNDRKDDASACVIKIEF